MRYSISSKIQLASLGKVIFAVILGALVRVELLWQAGFRDYK